MAADEFIWLPENGASCEYTQAVTTDGFGDGYEQVTAQGINSIVEKWSLSFAGRDPVEIAALIAFYRAKGQGTSFTWTAPAKNAIQKRYRFNAAPKQTCNDGSDALTCELKEVP